MCCLSCTSLLWNHHFSWLLDPIRQFTILREKGFHGNHYDHSRDKKNFLGLFFLNFNKISMRNPR